MDYLSKPMASIGFISVPVKSNTHLFKAVFWAIPKKGASGFYVWVSLPSNNPCAGESPHRQRPGSGAARSRRTQQAEIRFLILASQILQSPLANVAMCLLGSGDQLPQDAEGAVRSLLPEEGVWIHRMDGYGKRFSRQLRR